MLTSAPNHDEQGRFCQGNNANTLRRGKGRPRSLRGFEIPACGSWGESWKGYRIAVSGSGSAVVVLVHPKRTHCIELSELDGVRWLVAHLRAAGLRRVFRTTPGAPLATW